MYKRNAILLISSNTAEFANQTTIMTDFGIANTVKVVGNISEAASFLKVYSETHGHSSPELIFIDLEDMMVQGIEFLEVFSNLYLVNKERVRIIFLGSPAEIKESATLRVLGDFEFVNRPFTEETFFNCLIREPAY